MAAIIRTAMDFQDAVNVVAFSPVRQPFWCPQCHDSSSKEVRSDVRRLLFVNVKIRLPWSVWYKVLAFAVETEPIDPLYASGSGPQIQLWRGPRRVVCLRGHVSIVRALAFAPEHGRLLASASYDNTIKLWRLVADDVWRCTATLTGHLREVLAVSLQPLQEPVDDGQSWHMPVSTQRLLASGSWDGTVRVWSVDRAEAGQAALVQSHRVVAGATRAVAFAPDGDALATGCDDAIVRVHHGLRCARDDVILRSDDDDSFTEILRGHRNWVYGVAFPAKRSDLLASCSQDTTVKVWIRASEDEFLGSIWTLGHSVSCHKGWVYSVAFNADATLLASGAADHKIMVYRVHHHRPRRRGGVSLESLATLDDHDGIVYSVAFPPARRDVDAHKGALLASGSVDGTLALWRVSLVSSLTG